MVPDWSWTLCSFFYWWRQFAASFPCLVYVDFPILKSSYSPQASWTTAGSLRTTGRGASGASHTQRYSGDSTWPGLTNTEIQKVHYLFQICLNFSSGEAKCNLFSAREGDRTMTLKKGEIFLIKVQMFYTKYSCEMHVSVGRKYRILERFPATTEVWAIFGKWRGEIRKRAEISFLLTPERKWEKGVCVDPHFLDECMCFVCVRGTRKRHNIALQLERKKTRGKCRISQTKNLCAQEYL